MKDDIFSLIFSKADSFSKGQRRIAQYITEAYDKAAFMTAGRLGAIVGVSESTVVRFAVELGFDGYPSMQKAMQEMVLNRLTSVQRISVASDRLEKQDVLSLVLHGDSDKLRQTSELIDRNEFHLAVEAILKGKNIYVLGVRSAAPLADFMGYYLNFMFRNVHIVTTSGDSEMFEKLVNITAEDVVIAFSFPRYSALIAKGARYCRSVGATVIGLTDSGVSPLGQASDYVLLAKSDMVSLVDSLVAPLSVVNAILVALAAEREQTISQTFDSLERIWEQHNVYEKQVDKK